MGSNINRHSVGGSIDVGTAGLNKIQFASVTYDPLSRQAAALSLVPHRWATE